MGIGGQTAQQNPRSEKIAVGSSGSGRGCRAGWFAFRLVVHATLSWTSPERVVRLAWRGASRSSKGSRSKFRRRFAIRQPERRQRKRIFLRWRQRRALNCAAKNSRVTRGRADVSVFVQGQECNGPGDRTKTWRGASRRRERAQIRRPSADRGPTHPRRYGRRTLVGKLHS